MKKLLFAAPATASPATPLVAGVSAHEAREAEHLTARELDVLCLIAAGRRNAEISRELVLSEHTVARHITNLYGKIGARGKADATAYAFRHHLTED